MNRDFIHNPVKGSNRASGDLSEGFNITPIIDIVFLLIIFFLLVCRFIETQPQEVDLPQDIDSAESVEDGVSPVVITMTKSGPTAETYINGERISFDENSSGLSSARAKIDMLIESSEPSRKIATLRIDRKVTCRSFKHILKAIAESSVEDIRLAVIKEDS